MRGDLRGDMRGDLRGDLCGRHDPRGLGRVFAKFWDADDHAKVVALNQLGVGSAVLLAIKHHFAQARTQFVGAVDLPEEGAENGILLVKPETPNSHVATVER